jgi:ferrous iron transport protein A
MMPLKKSNMENLDQLTIGETAVIQGIDAEDNLFQRFAALGFRLGKKVQIIRRATFNGPLHVRLGTTDIILRKSEARRIHIAH